MVFSGLKQFKAVSSFFNVAGNHCHSGLFLNFGLCCQVLPASSETEVSHLTHDPLPHLSTLAIHKDTAFPQHSKDTNKNLKIEKEPLTSSFSFPCLLGNSRQQNIPLSDSRKPFLCQIILIKMHPLLSSHQL